MAPQNWTSVKIMEYLFTSSIGRKITYSLPWLTTRKHRFRVNPGRRNGEGASNVASVKIVEYLFNPSIGRLITSILPWLTTRLRRFLIYPGRRSLEEVTSNVGKHHGMTFCHGILSTADYEVSQHCKITNQHVFQQIFVLKTSRICYILTKFCWLTSYCVT